MANITYKLSPELTDDANYKSFDTIESTALVQGATIILYPGEYAAPTSAMSIDDVAFVGVGDRDEIVINGSFQLANTCANTITFENISFVGANATATSDSVCIEKLGIAAATVWARNCKFSNAEHAIRSHSTLALNTTNDGIRVDYCDAGSVDQALVANSNCTVNYSIMNTGSNAYFQASTAAGQTVTVRASTSGGSNTGNTVETVLALIS